MALDLKQMVRDYIAEAGAAESAKMFGVSLGTVNNWLNGKTPPSVDAAELVLGLTNTELPQQADEEPVIEWKGRKIALLLPVYKTFNPDTHFTLFANYAKYGPDKIAMPRPVKGTCVWEARNKLIEKALRIKDATDYLMFDDDMVLPFGMPDHFTHFYGKIPRHSAEMVTFTRLLSHPDSAGIVGVLYFGRHRGGRAQCQLGFKSKDESNKLRRGEYKGLVPMDWVGTGGVRIKRWVIEKMADAIAEGRWPECKPSKEGLHNGHFAPLRVGVGEDLSFCLRAKDIGIQTYLDASLECLHAGEALYGGYNTEG